MYLVFCRERYTCGYANEVSEVSERGKNPKTLKNGKLLVARFKTAAPKKIATAPKM